jgi:hypothetical protein
MLYQYKSGNPGLKLTSKAEQLERKSSLEE